MRRLLAWMLYKWGMVCLDAARFIQGDGPGPFYDFRSQLANRRKTANDV